MSQNTSCLELKAKAEINVLIQTLLCIKPGTHLIVSLFIFEILASRRNSNFRIRVLCRHLVSGWL
ncbi:MAG: hypothetical protein ACR2HF_06475 [Methylococcaceae bacterium]